MTLSIIIATKDREDDLLITLQSLLKQTCMPNEIIIVDQSQQNCEEKVLGTMKDSSIKLKYIWDRRISGLTEARARGLKESDGDIVFFLDDDITLDKYCIENLLKTYTDNPHLGGICAADTAVENMGLLRILITSLFNCGPFSGKKGGWFYTDLLIHHFHNKVRGLHYTWTFFGGLMSFRRQVAEEIGFDEKITERVSGEDIDIAFRASEKYPLALAPNVKVLHRFGTVLYNPKWAFERKVFAKWYFFTKNVEKTPFNIFCFLWALLGLLISATASTISSRSLDPLRGFLSAMKGMSITNTTYPPMRKI